MYPILNFYLLAQPGLDASIAGQKQLEIVLERLTDKLGKPIFGALFGYLLFIVAPIMLLSIVINEFITALIIWAMILPAIQLGIITGHKTANYLIQWKLVRKWNPADYFKLGLGEVSFHKKDRKWKLFPKIKLGGFILLMFAVQVVILTSFEVATEVFVILQGIIITTGISLVLIAQTLVNKGAASLLKTIEVWRVESLKNQLASIYFPAFIGVALFTNLAFDIIVNSSIYLQGFIFATGLDNHLTLLRFILIIEDSLILGIIALNYYRPNYEITDNLAWKMLIVVEESKNQFFNFNFNNNIKIGLTKSFKNRISQLTDKQIQFTLSWSETLLTETDIELLDSNIEFIQELMKVHAYVISPRLVSHLVKLLSKSKADIFAGYRHQIPDILTYLDNLNVFGNSFEYLSTLYDAFEDETVQKILKKVFDQKPELLDSVFTEKLYGVFATAPQFEPSSLIYYFTLITSHNSHLLQPPHLALLLKVLEDDTIFQNKYSIWIDRLNVLDLLKDILSKRPELLPTSLLTQVFNLLSQIQEESFQERAIALIGDVMIHQTEPNLMPSMHHFEDLVTQHQITDYSSLCELLALVHDRHPTIIPTSLINFLIQSLNNQETGYSTSRLSLLKKLLTTNPNLIDLDLIEFILVLQSSQDRNIRLNGLYMLQYVLEINISCIQPEHMKDAYKLLQDSDNLNQREMVHFLGYLLDLGPHLFHPNFFPPLFELLNDQNLLLQKLVLKTLQQIQTDHMTLVPNQYQETFSGTLASTALALAVKEQKQKLSLSKEAELNQLLAQLPEASISEFERSVVDKIGDLFAFHSQIFTPTHIDKLIDSLGSEDLHEEIDYCLHLMIEKAAELSLNLFTSDHVTQLFRLYQTTSNREIQRNCYYTIFGLGSSSTYRGIVEYYPHIITADHISQFLHQYVTNRSLDLKFIDLAEPLLSVHKNHPQAINSEHVTTLIDLLMDEEEQAKTRAAYILSTLFTDQNPEVQASHLTHLIQLINTQNLVSQGVVAQVIESFSLNYQLQIETAHIQTATTFFPTLDEINKGYLVTLFEQGLTALIAEQNLQTWFENQIEGLLKSSKVREVQDRIRALKTKIKDLA